MAEEAKCLYRLSISFSTYFNNDRQSLSGSTNNWRFGSKAKFEYVFELCYANILLKPTSQGFDEFMNLVIDDAVEVKLAHKGEEEKRRELGRFTLACMISSADMAQARYY